MIGNETDLHYKVVDLMRKYYPDSILVVGLGENQDTEDKRPDSYKKGYTRGQPDLLVLNYHKYYKGLGVEFKSPTNDYHVSEAQKKVKKKYRNNGYAFVLSNDYDKICMNIHEYMKGIKLPCKYCSSGHFYLSFVSTKLGDITILKNRTRPKMTRAHSLKICHPDAVRLVFSPGLIEQPIALLEIWKFAFGQKFHLRQVVSSCEIQCLSILAC